jgi:Tfp pilus assembly protein PilZ
MQVCKRHGIMSLCRCMLCVNKYFPYVLSGSIFLSYPSFYNILSNVLSYPKLYEHRQQLQQHIEIMTEKSTSCSEVSVTDNLHYPRRCRAPLYQHLRL